MEVLLYAAGIGGALLFAFLVGYDVGIDEGYKRARQAQFDAARFAELREQRRIISKAERDYLDQIENWKCQG